MIENVSTQLTVFHCLCPLPASRKGLRLPLRSALFGEGAEIGGRGKGRIEKSVPRDHRLSSRDVKRRSSGRTFISYPYSHDLTALNDCPHALLKVDLAPMQ